MSMQTIRTTYGVPAKRGGRVEYSDNGTRKLGTIRSAQNGYLRIQMDGCAHSAAFHPQWNLRYLDAPESGPADQTPPVSADASSVGTAFRSQIPLKTEDEAQYAHYLQWIEDTHPEHERTSCNDSDLYNGATVTLMARCARCDALTKLKGWRAERERDVLETMLTADQRKRLGRSA